ncbi:GNAT family N-acetyltransferase [Microbulbifer bruguierae]|uniref:GNAT family N-acetyltransferase n=1 Tax=Microbulbifer bruguierae TaxID=3029061 RepID=A0ABY8NC82_9GAMM|nr:GNAT family N-acetyltransferase [Microbulbifer bruguierae]WGL16530.1 GNAT family N-acetyltransferase [Microbulbifer bruguierae]
MIEVVSQKNLSEVLPLIRAYQEFYNVTEISDDRNSKFFSQFGESCPSGCQFIYREAGIVVGFATVYFSFTTSITAKVAVLNDLYTLPNCRGKGIGRQLIEYCRSFAEKNGAARLQWVTATDNEQAQKLYDSLNTGKSTWHFYTYNT